MSRRLFFGGKTIPAVDALNAVVEGDETNNSITGRVPEKSDVSLQRSGRAVRPMGTNPLFSATDTFSGSPIRARSIVTSPGLAWKCRRSETNPVSIAKSARVQPRRLLLRQCGCHRTGDAMAPPPTHACGLYFSSGITQGS